MKFASEVVFQQTKTMFENSLNFMRTGQTQSLHFWFYFEPALPYGDGQNRNNKYFSLKFLTIEVSKYVKLKALSSLPFPGKLQLIFVLPGLFLVGKRVGSHVQWSESKSAYFTNTIPSQPNIKKFWFQHFPILQLQIAKDI